MLNFISVYAVRQALKEHLLWALCAALSTERPVRFGPNLRVLYPDGCSAKPFSAIAVERASEMCSQAITMKPARVC